MTADELIAGKVIAAVATVAAAVVGAAEAMQTPDFSFAWQITVTIAGCALAFGVMQGKMSAIKERMDTRDGALDETLKTLTVKVDELTVAMAELRGARRGRE